MKILIVGAGIGGLTLASFLQDSNIEYEIVEKSKDWSHQGYSIGLWNNGRNILKKLGLTEKFDAAGSRIHSYCIRDGKGNLIRNYNLKDFYATYGMAYTHIDRAVLHDLLGAKLDTSKVKMGVTVESIVDSHSEVLVTLSDGTQCFYDLVVGADGIHSKVRDLCFSQSVESFDNYRVWYAWVDKKYALSQTVTEYVEAGEFIGIFDCDTRAMLVMIAPCAHGVWDTPESRIARLKEIFKNETAVMPGILDGLAASDISPTDLSHIRLSTWVKGRVMLLGDAAHGFEPHAGVGGSMAMEDAYVLAGELMKIDEKHTLATALDHYQSSRMKRVACARTLSNRMKIWAHVKSAVLRKAINYVMSHIPDSFFITSYRKLLDQEI